MGTTSRKRVIVIGAGFGGLWAVRTLAGSGLEVVLVDRSNHHTFLPLLYQVAAAELAPEEIAFPARAFLRRLRGPVCFLLGEVQSIDLEARRIETAHTSLDYDYLILATGSTSHFFGVTGASEHAFRLKSLDQAIALRNHILRCFERADHLTEAEACRQALTFVIVGGGAMGVEFAGALAELVYGPLRKDYPALDIHKVRIFLLEAMDQLLSDLPHPLQSYAVKRLERMGIRLRLGTPVESITEEAVHLKNGEVIHADTVIWTAGVRGEGLAEKAGLATDRRGRALVLPTLQAVDHPEVYVIGDLAHFETNGEVLPMVAPVAIQQGTAAARNILRVSRGLPPEPFRYKDMGRMATIGRNAAVALLLNRHFTGLPAWFLWLAVHLLNLIGFRNRLIVLINWAWDYFFLDRAVRLILPTKE